MSNGIQVGLDNLVYATLTKDDSTGVTYGVIKKVPGIINAKVSTKTNSATLYADDSAAETATAVGETEVEIETKELPLDVQSDWFGHTVVKGVMTKKSTDIAPYIAIGYRSVKSNGKYKYMWLLKGRFETPDFEGKTKEDKPNFVTPKTKGTFVARDYDKAYIRQADEEVTGFEPSTATNWFTSVEGITDTVAPTVTTAPLDGATGVAVGDNVVLTFNKAIQVDTANSSNIFLMKADGTDVATTLSIDADNKVVTLDPTADLTTGAYVAVVTTNVKSVAGVALAQKCVINFTV
jgi:phi13 family phage major tail protein